MEFINVKTDKSLKYLEENSIEFINVKTDKSLKYLEEKSIEENPLTPILKFSKNNKTKSFLFN